MPNSTWIAALALAITSTCNVMAESHCPGNVASLPYKLAKGHLMVIEVSINSRGPYEFLLDTGSRFNMIDPAIAARMHLASEGEMDIDTLGAHATVAMVDVPRVDVGSHALIHQDAVVYSLKNLRAGMRLDGIVGENFLSHFDVFIDNMQHIVCLDDGGAMRSEVKGHRVPFQTASGTQTLASVVVEANLSDVAAPVHLKLDSGANESVLFRAPAYTAFRRVNGSGAEGAAQMFTKLPRQGLRIGSLEVAGVEMVTFVKQAKIGVASDCDGVLSTALFHKILIEHSDRLIVLEPW